MRTRLLTLIVLVMFIVACGEEDERDPDPLPTLTPAPATVFTPEPGLDLDERVMLEGYYETLRQAQQQIEGIWTDVRDGKEVACSTELVETVSPESVQDTFLFQAAVYINEARALWVAECDKTRQFPPPDMVNDAVNKALAAGDLLDRAKDQLER